MEIEGNGCYLENSIIEAQQLTLLLWAEDVLMYFFYIFLVFCYKYLFKNPLLNVRKCLGAQE